MGRENRGRGEGRDLYFRRSLRDGEMAKHLRALANLLEVTNAVSATGVELDSTACNSSLGI